jgi:hypothetical protein
LCKILKKGKTMAINLQKKQSIETGLSKIGVGLGRLMLLVFCTMLVACTSPKDRYISGFTDFVTDVEQNQDSFSKEDWQNLDAKFKKYAQTDIVKYREQLNDEDKKSIGKLHGRYLAARTKAAGKQLINGIQDGINYIGGLIDGLNEKNDTQ